MKKHITLGDAAAGAGPGDCRDVEAFGGDKTSDRRGEEAGWLRLGRRLYSGPGDSRLD
jgi:hypothetical protein